MVRCPARLDEDPAADHEEGDWRLQGTKVRAFKIQKERDAHGSGSEHNQRDEADDEVASAE